MTKFVKQVRPAPFRRPQGQVTLLIVMGLLAGCGGGGGGSSAPPQEPEAVVASVANAQVLRPVSGVRSLEFLVTMSKPVVRGVELIFSTVSTSKEGLSAGISTGSAKGDLSCAVSGADYETLNAVRLSIPIGATSARQTVAVCSSAQFQPNETLKVNWTSSGSQVGSAIGTIVNAAPGGLNSGGSKTTLTGSAFGRDVNPLTNDDADGALGFSFERRSADGVAASAADRSDWKCTYDRVSGLTWQRLPNTNRTFASLPEYVASINANAACGYSDWRVPTVSELLSLMDSSRLSDSAPNADRDGSLDAMGGVFWSVEGTAFASDNAWVVDAANMGAVSFAAKTNAYGVRLVRGINVANSCADVSRYIDFLDGTVQDTKTGLMWKKCPDGLSGDSCSEGAAVGYDNTDGVSLSTKLSTRLATVNSTAALGSGYSDWRVPSRNELASLVNRSCRETTANITIPSSKFPNTGAYSYISSTLDATTAGQFWFVNFSEGAVGVGGQSLARRLRLVRGGQ